MNASLGLLQTPFTKETLGSSKEATTGISGDYNSMMGLVDSRVLDVATLPVGEANTQKTKHDLIKGLSQHHLSTLLSNHNLVL